MKIAHVFYSLSYGGIETLMVNIANWQVENGHKVKVILINNTFENTLIDMLDRRVEIIQLGRIPKTNAFMSILKLNLHLLIHQVDILHIHAAEIGNVIQPFLKAQKVLHIHATVGITHAVIPKHDKCIAISESVKRVLESQYNTKSAVIYNGIDFHKFKKRKSNFSAGKMICVGSLTTKIKNQDGLIHEFSYISNKIDADLYIVGDGPDYDMLQELINRLNLENRVFLLGNKSQIWIQNNLCNFDLFIQASHTEGLGIAAIEAAASRIPLLLSKIDGHIEISQNGDLCELFNPLIQGELGKGILEFYRDPELYFEHAVKNYQIQQSKFNFKLYNQKILNLYASA